MSLLIGEAIQRLQSMYSRGVQSKDSRLTSRHIYSALKTARSIVYRQRANSNQSISQWAYQTLPCVELISAPIHECPCVPTDGCKILRTKYKIPKFIQNISGVAIQSATTLDGGIYLDETKFESVKNNSGNKYTSKKPKRYFRNGYMYITINTKLKGITITGLFDDPIEAAQFPSICPCEDCNPCKDIMELEFPIDMDLMDALLKIAREELILIFKQMGEDRNADASDDALTKGAMVHQP
jgi:hypothetical protein